QLAGVLARVRLAGPQLVEVVVGADVLEGVLLLLRQRVLRIRSHTGELRSVLHLGLCQGGKRQRQRAASAELQELAATDVEPLRRDFRRGHALPPRPSVRRLDAAGYVRLPP